MSKAVRIPDIAPPEPLFVFANKDIRISDDILVETNDVGIVLPEANRDGSIFMVRLWQNVILHERDYNVFNQKRTGDGFETKICNVCHKLLPTINFARNQNGVNNRPVRRPSCQECRIILEGEDMAPTDRREWERRKPHNTPFECPICSKRTIAGVTCRIVLDHNHTTGNIRGWICDSCNTGIGRFKDDIALLRRAIQFLEI
jgi:hypothetical protein